MASVTKCSPSLLDVAEQTNCPICLELLQDEAQHSNYEVMRQDDYLVTVLCGHTFHSDCLKGWTDLTCPLCKYHQSPC